MNEESWLNSSDPMSMLALVDCNGNQRRVRLFALQQCRKLANFCHKRLGWEGARWASSFFLFLDRYAECGAASQKLRDKVQRLLASCQTHRDSLEGRLRDLEEERRRAEHELSQADANFGTAAEPRASVEAYARAERALERARQQSQSAEEKVLRLKADKSKREGFGCLHTSPAECCKHRSPMVLAS
jgi:hypothetical protein